MCGGCVFVYGWEWREKWVYTDYFAEGLDGEGRVSFRFFGGRKGELRNVKAAFVRVCFDFVYRLFVLNVLEIVSIAWTLPYTAPQIDC